MKRKEFVLVKLKNIYDKKIITIKYTAFYIQKENQLATKS